jgi:hypothetical protein
MLARFSYKIVKTRTATHQCTKNLTYQLGVSGTIVHQMYRLFSWTFDPFAIINRPLEVGIGNTVLRKDCCRFPKVFSQNPISQQISSHDMAAVRSPPLAGVPELGFHLIFFQTAELGLQMPPKVRQN